MPNSRPAAEKVALRAAALQLRAETGIAAAEAATAPLNDRALALALDRAAPPAVVSAYAALADEADPAALVAALAARGFQTALPVTGARGTPLTFRLWRPGDPLAAGRRGIREPPASAPEAWPDLVFVPLLAFDRQGGRIGYGAGFYDLTLAHLRAQKPVLAAGFAYSWQEAKFVPAEAHDARLDFVVTESEVIDCRSGQGFGKRV